MIYTVIAYKLYEIDGEPKRIYDDSTEQSCTSLESVEEYRGFLEEQGKLVDVYTKEIKNTIDVNALRLILALEKLSPKEKQLLGIN